MDRLFTCSKCDTVFPCRTCVKERNTRPKHRTCWFSGKAGIHGVFIESENKVCAVEYHMCSRCFAAENDEEEDIWYP